MNMAEIARMITGLQSAGWSEKEMNDFMLWIGTGEEQYRPGAKNSAQKESN